MELMLIILLSLCVIVFVLLVVMYNIYSKNVSLNQSVTVINTKLEEMDKSTKDTKTASALRFENINEKINNTVQQNLSDLQNNLDVYGAINNSNASLLSEMTESHSVLTSDIDAVAIDLNTIESNVLEHQNTFSQSLTDIEQAFSNHQTGLKKDITSLHSNNADLNRRLVEYKVSNDYSYDTLRNSFTELDEEMEMHIELQDLDIDRNTERIEELENKLAHINSDPLFNI